jgi:hypothetical protein
MPEGGIEPPRGCPPGILSPVRLPIPPPRPGGIDVSIFTKAGQENIQSENELGFLSACDFLSLFV